MKTSSPGTWGGPVAGSRHEIRWTEQADRDLGRAILYLDERNPRAAHRFARNLLHRVGLLSEQPDLGAPVDIDNAPTPYRRLICGDYGVYYRADADGHTLFIVRVWNNSRNPGELVLG